MNRWITLSKTYHDCQITVQLMHIKETHLNLKDTLDQVELN